MLNFSFSTVKKDKLQISSNDSDEIELIRDVLSVANPLYGKTKNKFIQSRLYAITNGGKFDFGLYQQVKELCELHDIKYEINSDVEDFFKPFEFSGNFAQLIYPFRPYQEEGIQKAIKNQNGLIVVGTGGGKTLLTAGLIETLRKELNKPNLKVMVTVPTLQLIEQTAADFESYGLKNISKWSGDNDLNPNADIIIAGTHYLTGKNRDLSILGEMDVFIADEAHRYLKANAINNVFKFLKPKYRFGLTGSLPPNKIDLWNLIGKFGPVLMEMKTDELKKQNYVSDFKIYILNLFHRQTKFGRVTSNNPVGAFRSEMNYLNSSTYRNEFVSKLALKTKKNTIIMLDRIDHGINLTSKLKFLAPDRKIFFICGDTEIEDRENIRKLMDNEDGVIVVAISSIFSTGINIPNLHCIIFATTGKSKIRIIQSIGRALRLHKSKDKAVIFDIADNTKYGLIHKEERKKLYESENYSYIEKDILHQ